jgi:hypothetical protein
MPWLLSHGVKILFIAVGAYILSILPIRSTCRFQCQLFTDSDWLWSKIELQEKELGVLGSFLRHPISGRYQFVGRRHI